jgi:hypothetical protein
MLKAAMLQGRVVVAAEEEEGVVAVVVSVLVGSAAAVEALDVWIRQRRAGTT